MFLKSISLAFLYADASRADDTERNGFLKNFSVRTVSSVSSKALKKQSLRLGTLLKKFELQV